MDFSCPIMASFHSDYNKGLDSYLTWQPQRCLPCACTVWISMDPIPNRTHHWNGKYWGKKTFSLMICSNSKFTDFKCNTPFELVCLALQQGAFSKLGYFCSLWCKMEEPSQVFWEDSHENKASDQQCVKEMKLGLCWRQHHGKWKVTCRFVKHVRQRRRRKCIQITNKLLCVCSHSFELDFLGKCQHWLPVVVASNITSGESGAGATLIVDLLICHTHLRLA